MPDFDSESIKHIQEADIVVGTAAQWESSSLASAPGWSINTQRGQIVAMRFLRAGKSHVPKNLDLNLSTHPPSLIPGSLIPARQPPPAGPDDPVRSLPTCSGHDSQSDPLTSGSSCVNQNTIALTTCPSASLPPRVAPLQSQPNS